MTNTNGDPLTPDRLRATQARLRVDRLRTALRGGGIDPQRVAEELPAWLRLFRDVRDGAFRVLLLELLQSQRDASVDELFREASQDRSDGVRLEALRFLSARFPDEVPRLADRHREDENLEVRVLLGIRLHESQPELGEERLLEALRSEAGGIKERQALERVLGFFVEEARARHLLPRLEQMRDDFDDPEDFFGWARERLGKASN